MMKIWTKQLIEEVNAATAVGLHCAVILVSGSSEPAPHELDQIYCGTPVLKTYLGHIMPNFKVALDQITMNVHSLMGHDCPCVPDGKKHQPPEPTRKQDYHSMCSNYLMQMMKQRSLYAENCKCIDWKKLPCKCQSADIALINWPDSQDWKSLFWDQAVSNVGTAQWQDIWNAFFSDSVEARPTL